MSKLSLILILFVSFQSVALQKFTVLLDWQLSPIHAPMVIAKHKNYYTEAGLDVTFLTPSNPSDQPKMVASQKVDVALYSPDKTLKAIESGLPIRHCGTLIKSPLAAVAVLKNGSIQTLKDLKGKTIGRSGSQKSLVLATMLRHQGLKIEDVNLVQLQYGLAPALVTKGVDAVMIFRNVEPSQLKQMGHETRLFLCEDHGVPSHDALIFIAHSKPSPHLKSFLDATDKGLKDIHKNQESAWSTFQAFNQSTSKLIHKDIWNLTKDLFPASIKDKEVEKTKVYIDFLKENKFLNQTIKTNYYYSY